MSESERIILKGIEHHEFVDEISSTMYTYSYSSDGADYICGFCKERPERNGENITHRNTCFGRRLLDSMTNE